jgi:hypothetical protein
LFGIFYKLLWTSYLLTCTSYRILHLFQCCSALIIMLLLSFYPLFCTCSSLQFCTTLANIVFLHVLCFFLCTIHILFCVFCLFWTWYLLFYAFHPMFFKFLPVFLHFSRFSAACSYLPRTYNGLDFCYSALMCYLLYILET